MFRFQAIGKMTDLIFGHSRVLSPVPFSIVETGTIPVKDVQIVDCHYLKVKLTTCTVTVFVHSLIP